METSVIKSLKSNLADLTYVLFVFRNEFELMIQNSTDEKANKVLREFVTSLTESNKEVIRLYHEIESNEVGIQNEWYNDDTKINTLRQEVNNLNYSIHKLIEVNKIISSNC